MELLAGLGVELRMWLREEELPERISSVKLAAPLERFDPAEAELEKVEGPGLQELRALREFFLPRGAAQLRRGEAEEAQCDPKEPRVEAIGSLSRSLEGRSRARSVALSKLELTQEAVRPSTPEAAPLPVEEAARLADKIGRS